MAGATIITDDALTDLVSGGVDQSSTDPIIESRPFLTNEELKTSLLFDKDDHLENIAHYVKGMKWTVDYFLQIRDINDTINQPDPALSPTIQKYHRINNLIITLQNPITQDDINNITGEAVINSGFLPNMYDAFKATLLGGRQAVFILTNVVARNYNLHPAYYVEFKLYKFLDDDQIAYNDLVYKTIKEYNYDKDHLLDFSAPIILASDYKKKLDLKNIIVNLTDYYFKKFIHPEKNVLSLPTESSVYTDTLLTEFILKIINNNDSINVMNLTRLDVDLKQIIDYTIWDMIINRDISMLKRIKKNIGFKYTPYSPSNIVTRHISYLGINFIATLLNAGETAVVPNVIDISTSKDDDYQPPVLTSDENYVLSEAFYSYTADATNCGLLEQLLIDYLKGNILNTESLYTLINQYTSWSTIEQFYYIPILMVLVRDSINNTYSQL